MPTTAVQEILKEIDMLGDEDRQDLEKALRQRLDKEWAAEVNKARRKARQKKITQATIDAAIEKRRYRR